MGVTQRVSGMSLGGGGGGGGRVLVRLGRQAECESESEGVDDREQGDLGKDGAAARCERWAGQGVMQGPEPDGLGGGRRLIWKKSERDRCDRTCRPKRGQDGPVIAPHPNHSTYQNSIQIGKGPHLPCEFSSQWGSVRRVCSPSCRLCERLCVLTVRADCAS